MTTGAGALRCAAAGSLSRDTLFPHFQRRCRGGQVRRDFPFTSREGFARRQIHGIAAGYQVIYQRQNPDAPLLWSASRMTASAD
jgi:hypothetical protein